MATRVVACDDNGVQIKSINMKLINTESMTASVSGTSLRAPLGGFKGAVADFQLRHLAFASTAAFRTTQAGLNSRKAIDYAGENRGALPPGIIMPTLFMISAQSPFIRRGPFEEMLAAGETLRKALRTRNRYRQICFADWEEDTLKAYQDCESAIDQAEELYRHATEQFRHSGLPAAQTTRRSMPRRSQQNLTSPRGWLSIIEAFLIFRRSAEPTHHEQSPFRYDCDETNAV